METKLLDLEPKRRDAILNAALKEFALRGFDNASTNVIARESGISKALMFHYANNKQALFLCVYDYFEKLLDEKYFTQMDFTEKDIFERLRQSYLLQVALLKQHPWIFEFNKLSITTGSDEVNLELEKRAHKKQDVCCTHLFDRIEESKFRTGLDVEKCKQLILWMNVGFTNQLLEDIRNAQPDTLNYDIVMNKLEDFFGELKKVFYTSSDG